MLSRLPFFWGGLSQVCVDPAHTFWAPLSPALKYYSKAREKGEKYFRDRQSLSSLEMAGRSSICSSTMAWLLLWNVFALDPTDAFAASLSDNMFPPDVDVAEGVASVTRSDVGLSFRRGAVRGSQLADVLDQKWARFSDSLRDKSKCDPVTNRRMFDNGFRRDGTRVGDPVLGALCDPLPLSPLDDRVASNVVLGLAEEAAMDALTLSNIKDESVLFRKVTEVGDLVAPAFSRAASGRGSGEATEQRLPSETETALQKAKRQKYNMDIYTRSRAYGEVLIQKNSVTGANSGRIAFKEVVRAFELSWGKKLLLALAPNANRNDFKTPFRLPDATDDLPYDKGSLLDSLGAVSVALGKLQEGGLIGQWEISIPEDDYGNVVTIAVDDDISIGAQVLLREQGHPLNGSAVVALVRAAMDMARIPYNIDSFFIDPSTTKQELYNPTQLLVNLSNIAKDG